jgi:phytoene dehydrogenase-like protein
MTRDNVIASRVYTPYDIELLHPNMHEGSIACGDMIVSQMDRFRPTPELSNYRTPIKNFYLCSSASHNGVGTGRGCSRNCYQVISEDLSL